MIHSTRTPHIMHVVANLDLGGSEEVALSLTEMLSPSCRFSFFAVQGIAPTTVGQDMHKRLSHLDIPVYCGTKLDMKVGGVLQAGVRLRSVLKRVKPDILHLHTDIPDGTYAASRLFGQDHSAIRVIRTVHNTVLWPKWQRIGRWVERYLEHTGIVAVSPASLEGLHSFRARQGLKRLPDAQCRIVYNGVAKPSARVERTPGPLRVLFAGRMEPQKGVDLLPAILERAAQLAEVQACVTFLGHGQLSGLIERWIATKPIKWQLKIAPPTPRLAQHLSEFDVVLMPSRFEGLSLLCIESLMSGTPIIVSHIDGLRELFPADYDLLARPEDVESFAQLLAKVLTSPESYRQRAQLLINSTTQRFGLSRMAGEYQQIYQETISRAAS